jgi:hypothetical protein
MASAWGLGAGVLERRVHRMFQDLSDRKHCHHAALLVAHFHAGVAEWGTRIHKLPHKIARAIFGFRQGVFQVGELRTFFVAGHSALIAQINEIAGHNIDDSD